MFFLLSAIATITLTLSEAPVPAVAFCGFVALVSALAESNRYRSGGRR